MSLLFEYTSEIYPTQLRGTGLLIIIQHEYLKCFFILFIFKLLGMGFACVLGNIGSVIMPFFGII